MLWMSLVDHGNQNAVTKQLMEFTANESWRRWGVDRYANCITISS